MYLIHHWFCLRYHIIPSRTLQHNSTSLFVTHTHNIQYTQNILFKRSNVALHSFKQLYSGNCLSIYNFLWANLLDCARMRVFFYRLLWEQFWPWGCGHETQGCSDDKSDKQSGVNTLNLKLQSEAPYLQKLRIPNSVPFLTGGTLISSVMRGEKGRACQPGSWGCAPLWI